MPHKRAKRSVREQQRKERSVSDLDSQTRGLPLICPEAQILPHPAVITAQASAPNASPSRPRACWMRRGSAQNIDRSVRGKKRTRTTKMIRARRSLLHPRNVVRTREREQMKARCWGRRGRWSERYHHPDPIRGIAQAFQSVCIYFFFSLSLFQRELCGGGLSPPSLTTWLCLIFFSSSGEWRTTCVRWYNPQCARLPRPSAKDGKEQQQQRQRPPPMPLNQQHPTKHIETQARRPSPLLPLQKIKSPCG
jgi:hypothetical protein